MHQQSVARQALRAGHAVPDSIANAPELQIGLQLYLQAFFDLDSERMQGLAPIPWLSIRSYALAYDLNESQTEDLFFFVKRLDASHLKRMQDKLK